MAKEGIGAGEAGRRTGGFHKEAEEAMEKRQWVTSDITQIPKTCVRLSDWGCNKKNQKCSPEYRLLKKAWDDGRLSGWKIMATPKDTHGAIYVDADEAKLLLQSQAVSHATPKPRQRDDTRTEAACTALCEINNAIAVLNDTLRDLVAAVQLLGEQQGNRHEHAGAWRDMNGESL